MRPGGPPAALAALVVAATVAMVLAVVAGCGKKGPPHPPPRLIPAQTTDLAVRQTGDHLVLDLSYPSVTTSGLPLSGIEALEVLALRAPPTPPGAAPATLDARTFGATAKVVKRLAATELAAVTRGARLVVELDAAPGSPLGPRPEDEGAVPPFAAPVVDPPPAPDAAADPVAAAQPASPGVSEPAAAAALTTTETAPAATPGAPPASVAPSSPPPLLIAIRTFGPRGNESPLSNLVALLPRVPPPPPDSLVATATAGGVALTWSARPGVGAGAAAGFDLLRRRVGENTFDARVAQVGPELLEHLDVTVTFGDRYEYTVRTVAARDPLIESVDGPIAAVAYQDVFAPPTPGGLVALAEEGRIRLLWNRVDATDLAGYRLYRQENDGDVIALERATGAGNDHSDDQVRRGATYTYRVTAVDHEGNESARSEPVTATPR